MVDEDNKLIDFYRYGDDYAVPWPYDTDMGAVMETIEKIVFEAHSSCHFEAGGYAFSTCDGWVFSMLDDQKNSTSGNGKTMLEAAYNALVKFVKNENERNKGEDL